MYTKARGKERAAVLQMTIGDTRLYILERLLFSRYTVTEPQIIEKYTRGLYDLSHNTWYCAIGVRYQSSVSRNGIYRQICRE